MSELSKDKTIRKYLNLLSNYHWEKQISFFITEESQIDTFLSDMKEIRAKLRSHNRNSAFLYRVALLKQPSYKTNWYEGESGSATAPYMTIYSSVKGANILQALENSNIDSKYNLSNRAVKPLKLESTINSIKKQKPHNLDKFFNGEKVIRYGVINRKNLIEVDLNEECLTQTPSKIEIKRA